MDGSPLPRLVLASASPRRRDLLDQHGIAHLVHPSRVPEDDVPGLDPGRLAARHARDKACAVAPLFPATPTLGADTVVVVGQRALGKPRDMAEARRMLRLLAGRAHQVVTAVCIVRQRDRRMVEFAESTTVVFHPLDERAIGRYLERIDPLDKAGGYAAQQHREMIIARIDGLLSNVIGLPVERVAGRLGEF